jgi:hypothetical protein
MQGVVTKFTVLGLNDDFSFMYPIAPFVWMPMQDEQKERWRELCELAETEPDRDKLLALTQEINRLLEEDENRRKAVRKSTDNPSGDLAHLPPQ